MNRMLPAGVEQGGYQGQEIIGEVTEAIHRFILDGWDSPEQMPRIEEDLSFTPKDREEVIYVQMYKASQNSALVNSKRLRQANIEVEGVGDEPAEVYYERPPLYLDLSYLVAVHAKFHSDAQRLLGWVLLRLHEASHLVYRPRKYLLPSGGEMVDSMGRAWDVEATGGDDLIMEKVSIRLTDDLTIGDAINFFTVHEAPYRLYATYQARCALTGALISVPGGTTIRQLPLDSHSTKSGAESSSNGRPRRSKREESTVDDSTTKKSGLKPLKPTNSEES